VVAPSIDEAPLCVEGARESSRDYLERMAREKLADVAARERGSRARRESARASGVVLAADTAVLLDGAILGKPANDAEARAMLSQLAGRAHEVTTAFAIGNETRTHVELVTTRVEFRAIADEEIDAYVASGEGRDKAGAYAVQGRAAAFVTRIDGSYTNVVGLPACEVWLALRAFGVV